MDPTANLARIRAILNKIHAEDETDSSDATPELHLELEELVAALDEWMSKGGFLPEQWQGR